MKILAVGIQNLASLFGDFFIDFREEPLKSSGIFAITGITGAGKSTILDAVCLALFAKTPRHTAANESSTRILDFGNNTLSISDPRTLLSRGAAQGMAEVLFVGIDNKEYKAVWSIRRARNKHNGSLLSDSHQFFNISDNKELTGKKRETEAEITRALGLNYEQFIRSALLAQGDFAAFAKAAESDKSDLLEKLTDTGIYSKISQKIYQKSKEEKILLANLEQGFAGIELLDSAQRLELDNELKELQIQLTANESLLDLLSKELTWQYSLKEITDELTIKLKKYNEAQETELTEWNNIQKIKILDAIQEIKSDILSMQQYSRLLTEKRSALTISRETIPTVIVRINQAETRWNNEKTDLANLHSELEQAEPLLREAESLDAQLKEKRSAEAMLLDEENIHLMRYKNSEAEVAEKTEQIIALKNEAKEKEAWLSKYNRYQILSENSLLIRSKLEELEDNATASENNTIHLHEKNETIQKRELKIKEIQTNFQALREEESALLNNIEAQIKLLENYTIGDIKNQLKILGEAQKKTQNDKYIWEQYYSRLQIKTNIEKDILSERSEIEQKTAELEVQNRLLPELENNFNSADWTFKKIQSEFSKEITGLRQQLSDDRPCPVCGSLHHPYKENDNRVRAVIDSLALERTNAENQYRRALKITTELHTEIDVYSKNLSVRQRDLDSISNEILQYAEQWNRLSVEYDHIPENLRSKYFDDIINHNSQEWSRINSLREEHDNEANNLENMRVQYGVVQSNRIEREKHLAEQQSELKNIHNEKKQIEDAIASLQKQNSNIETFLNQYFLKPGWYNHWRNQKEQFLQSFADCSNSWKYNNDLFVQLTNNIISAEKELVAMEKTLQVHREHYEKTRQSCIKTRAEISSAIQTRNRIFDGKPAQEIRNILQEKINAKIVSLQESQKHVDDLSKQRAVEESNVELISKDIIELEGNIAKKKIVADEWLVSYNSANTEQLSAQQVVEFSNIPIEWITAERNRLAAIRQQTSLAKASLMDQQTRVDEHNKKRVSERNADELHRFIDDAKIAQRNIQEQKIGVLNQLHLDEENKKKAGELFEKIELQKGIANRWSSLNEIIGSADGKKFRVIAQGYTLDFVLEFANIHMQILAPRYILSRIEKSLSLQIADMDMGGEIRSVYSLSGGELFLVSLALALGLSSLASGRLNIESMFIDEGFGSLDSATLHSAMNALETLQNQGRKVGIISHVQEMQERISTQIRVEKISGGKSSISVVG